MAKRTDDRLKPAVMSFSDNVHARRTSSSTAPPFCSGFALADTPTRMADFALKSATVESGACMPTRERRKPPTKGLRISVIGGHGGIRRLASGAGFT